MEALTNAQAHSRLVDESISELQDAIKEVPAAVGPEAKAGLATARDNLAAANEALAAAVTEIAVTVAGVDRAKRNEAINGARANVKQAESKTEAARAAIMAVQQSAPPPASGAAGALNVATGTMADTQNAIEAVNAAANQAANAISRTPRKVIQTVILVVGAVILVFVWQLAVRPAVGQFTSVTFASVVMITALLILTWTGGEHGILGPIVGADNRVSTSKTQFGIWTLAVGFALAFLLGRVLWDSADLKHVLTDERLGEYLILIGGPFAAGVLAKLAVTWKTENGTLQKTPAVAASPSQLVEDDSGNANLVDAQYLVFNVVALGYFVVRLAQSQELPEMPDVLLGLTSAAAATYTANKLTESNAPVITSVSPRSCLPGQQVRVSGYNFVAGTETSNAALVGILINGFAGELHPTLVSSGTELFVDLPLATPSGTRELRVRTAARVLSDPYLIEILESKPVIFGLESVAAPGADVTALGRNLMSPGNRAPSELIGVKVRDLGLFGETNGERVTFKVPGSLPPNTDVQLAVERAGSTSDPITVHIA